MNNLTLFFIGQTEYRKKALLVSESAPEFTCNWICSLVLHCKFMQLYLVHRCF